MSKTNHFTTTQVAHIAQLANIPVSDQEAASLAESFNETMSVVNQLQELDTSTVPTTHQVTGLENVTRDDEIDEDRMFTQEEALANAARQHQGYFVVPQVIEKD